MCKILTYNEIDRTEWAELVQASSSGTWFQTPEAYDFFASMRKLFLPFVVGIACDPAGAQTQLCAVCVGYVTVEKNPVRQFFMRRAIIIGGPALADDATDEEVKLLMNGVKELMNERMNGSPIYIETRNFNDFSHWKEAFENAGFAYQPHLNFHVACMDKGAMWERLSENRKRQIKKMIASNACSASREQVSLNNEVTEQDVREWYVILAELYRTKVKTPLWPVEFFLEAYRQRLGQYMMVRHEGKVIGGSMLVEDKKSVYEWFECGLNAQYKDQFPSVMATWAGMTYAAEHAIPRYDMMGAGEPGVPYGVRDFKSEFGGMMVEHGRFLHICKPLMYWLGRIAVKLLKARYIMLSF